MAATKTLAVDSDFKSPYAYLAKDLVYERRARGAGPHRLAAADHSPALR